MQESDENTILIGIDEAGVGPLLGPLVISATAFSIPRQLLKADLWQKFSDSVRKSKKSLAGRILITDSKKALGAKTSANPKKHLEKAVLASLLSLGKTPATTKQLLSELFPNCLPRLNNYDWYGKNLDCKLRHNADEISICSQAFADSMAKNQTSMLLMKSVCLDVAYYNEMIEKVRNKSTVIFSALCGLIYDILKNIKNQNYQFVIDRQGGRTKYTQPLRKMFPEMSLKVITEEKNISSYELTDSQRTIRLHFLVKADSKQLPVSLASMVSKFVRELLMDCINRYFTSQCDGLKPTAGYWTDGTRFVEELNSRAGHIEYDRNRLIRSR
ncbi:MAG: hypothetical protein K8R02_09565 [Anaerohalosphaeraceae bacterium]|nr:hypothetical protein [Anaerohalosphaeraceae bacterium]